MPQMHFCFNKSLILFAVWSWWGVSCFHVDFQMVWWIPVRIPQALASFMGFSKGGAFLNSPRLCCAKICRYSVRRICRWGGEVCHLEGCFQETSCYMPAPPPPQTDRFAPENWWLEDDSFPFIFRGKVLVSGRVPTTLMGFSESSKLRWGPTTSKLMKHGRENGRKLALGWS